jgi:hypothetical protein
MIKSDEIPFPEWKPDLGDYASGLTEAKNCFSYSGVYKPIYQLSSSTDAATSNRIISSFSMKGTDGTTHTFEASLTKIYKLDGTTWDDVTRSSGGDYTTSADGFWSFCAFGDLVIASNYNDDIQVFNVASSTNFAQLSSTAPRAKYIFITNNFLVCLDTVDSDGVIPNRVRWSPLGNPAGDWTASISTQAGFNDLFGGGFVNVAGVGNQTFATIIQDSAIWRMEYVGGDLIFSFSLDVQERGSKIAQSVRTNGIVTYFLDEDGFYAYDGRAALPIGRGKIDKWFYERFNSSYDYRITTAIDPINRLYLVGFPTVISGSEIPSLILVFNEVDGRWTYLEQSVQVLFEFLSSGVTLEQLSTQYPVLENVPFSLDSRFWQGGRFLSGAVTTTGAVGAFNGELPYEAEIGSQEIRLNVIGKTIVSSIEPIYEQGTAQGRVGYRDNLTSDVSYTPYKSVNSQTGEIDIMKNARYMRAYFKFTGDWDKAKGFTYISKPAGRV